MLFNLKCRFFKEAINVTPEFLEQMWEAPQTLGGGARMFQGNFGDTIWITKQGWGFSRSGSKKWGWVNLNDPNPGQGMVMWESQAIQVQEQSRVGNPGADGALIVGSWPENPTTEFVVDESLGQTDPTKGMAGWKADCARYKKEVEEIHAQRQRK